MRFIPKYKKISKLDNSLSPRISLRVLKFRRPKWKKVQKGLITTFKGSKSFVNPMILKNSYQHWDKVKNYYRDGIQFKTRVLSMYDNSFTINFFKKEILLNKKKTIKDTLLFGFIKPEFRIDILLWRLNFFSSSFQARQSINEGEIKLNNKKILGNVFLKKGDIISFSSCKSLSSSNITNIFSKLFNNDIFCTFIEVDFYTQTIVIIKNFEELTADDFSLFLTEYFDLKKFKDYL